MELLFIFVSIAYKILKQDKTFPIDYMQKKYYEAHTVFLNVPG